MIWFLLFATAITVTAFLFAPLLRENIEGRRSVFGITAIVSSLSIMGLYAVLGRPDLTGNIPAQSPQHSAETGTQQMTDFRENQELIHRLKTQLEESGSTDIQGWHLLARSQMQIGAYSEALESYERLTQIVPDNSDIRAEYDNAIAYVNRQMAMKDAAQMSPQDRQKMIENMVSGLAERIYENGGTADEWTRLLRARKVLNQEELLASDIERMKQEFENQPEVIQQILGNR